MYESHHIYGWIFNVEWMNEDDENSTDLNSHIDELFEWKSTIEVHFEE